MAKNSPFASGFRHMIPVTTGVIPFGAVMGTVAHEAGLSFFQTVSMNAIVYAGAAQLAAVDLMTKHAASIVVVLTGLIINLRFLLYSAAMSPVLRQQGFWTKFFCAHTLTDQSYAVMSANEEGLRSHADKTMYYIGTAVCMLLAWHLSVIAGFIFGNFAPASLALDYAVPLSFAALVMPTLKNRKYAAVAAFSFVVSIALNGLPYRLGLMATALLSIALAAVITSKKGRAA
jgi:4-azaleucine resistance transporter AzlC